MTRIATRTGSQLDLRIRIALLLVAVLAAAAMVHEVEENLGIQEIASRASSMSL